MELGLLGAGLLLGSLLGIWTALTMSANGDLRVDNAAMDMALVGEKTTHLKTTVTLDEERQAHEGTIRQLVSTEKLVIELSTVVEKFRNGETVSDDELPAAAGNLLDRLLSTNKNGDSSSSSDAPKVSDSSGSDTT